jgi:hypothetical protein
MARQAKCSIHNLNAYKLIPLSQPYTDRKELTQGVRFLASSGDLMLRARHKITARRHITLPIAYQLSASKSHPSWFLCSNVLRYREQTYFEECRLLGCYAVWLV